MEHHERTLKMEVNFNSPMEHEAEKASNSYIMSLLAVIVGLPLPIVNLATTVIFYLGNGKSTPFVRWHCTQALLSQTSLFLINSISLAWSLLILFGNREVNDSYIAFIITVLLFNVWEFIATIDAAVKIRKGIHVEWFFFGSLTHLLTREP